MALFGWFVNDSVINGFELVQLEMSVVEMVWRDVLFTFAGT